jgi:hypothetical protein
MNLTDLKQVLDERSSGSAEHVMYHVRLHGVRAKVVARRRRRVAAWTACAVLALAGIAATMVMPGLRTNVAPDPAASPSPDLARTIEGFPEYANGARVMAAESAELPQRRVELTIVPTTLDLVIFSRCDGTGTKAQLEQKVSVNGHDLASGSCGSASRMRDWDGLDVAVGKAATFVMTITGVQRLDDETGNVHLQIPETGTFGLAIGERIPFDAYPLPPRPSTLRPLEFPAGCTPAQCPDGINIWSNPFDPTRPVRRTVIWRTMESLDMVAQTPGFLHVRVNGVEVMKGEWWDYKMLYFGMYGDEGGAWKRDFGLDVRPGQAVTIEIVPEHITGAWQVGFTPAGTAEGQ